MLLCYFYLIKPGEGILFIVNDDRRLVLDITAALIGVGHYKSPLIAFDKLFALKQISLLEELGVKVALLDGILSGNSKSGSDGIDINVAIKGSYGDSVKTIGTSSLFPIPDADVPIVDMGNLNNILPAISKL